MKKASEKTPAGMKGGVRRPRGPGGTWSFTIDMGRQEANAASTAATLCGWDPSASMPAPSAAVLCAIHASGAKLCRVATGPRAMPSLSMQRH